MPRVPWEGRPTIRVGPGAEALIINATLACGVCVRFSSERARAMGPPPGRRSPPGTPNKDGASSSSSFAADLLRGSSSTTTATTRVLFVVVVIVITYAFLLSQPSIFVAKSGGDDRPVTAKWVRRMLNATQTQSLAYRTKLEETLAEYKTALDAIVKQNAELRERMDAVEAGSSEVPGVRLVSDPPPSRPAVPNGLIVTEVRGKELETLETVPDELLLAWLMNARRTTHNMPVEFWTGHTTKLGSWLSGFLEANAEWITLRRFPEQGKFPKSMRMPDSLSLNDERGAHIGKAYALAESAFSFPVFMDTDVFMCQGWWEKLMQLTADHPETDVFWTNDG